MNSLIYLILARGNKVAVKRKSKQLIIDLKHIFEYKKGKFISPFIFIGFFISLIFSQFELFNWTHPGIIFQNQTANNSVNFYTNDDIYFISSDDSSRIYSMLSGFGVQFEVDENFDLKFDIKHKKNRMRFYENLLNVDVHEDYKEFNSYLTYKGIKGLRPSLFMTAHRKYLAFGIISLIAIQTCFNIGVVTGALPTKGIPLPFMSSGVSSLLSSLFCIAVLARLEKEKVSL